jgi:acyl carrier protein
MAADPIAKHIQEFIAERFPAARNRTLEQDERLLENGILDSLGVLDLVAYLEQEFAITVTDDDLVPEHFETLERLTAFVAKRRGPGRQ